MGSRKSCQIEFSGEPWQMPYIYAPGRIEDGKEREERWAHQKCPPLVTQQQQLYLYSKLKKKKKKKLHFTKTVY